MGAARGSGFWRRRGPGARRRAAAPRRLRWCGGWRISLRWAKAGGRATTWPFTNHMAARRARSARPCRPDSNAHLSRRGPGRRVPVAIRRNRCRARSNDPDWRGRRRVPAPGVAGRRRVPDGARWASPERKRLAGAEGPEPARRGEWALPGSRVGERARWWWSVCRLAAGAGQAWARCDSPGWAPNWRCAASPECPGPR